MILALDFGIKNIGIAISDKNLQIAFPLKTIINDSNVYKKISDIIEQYNISKIIIGIPTINGRCTKNTDNVKKFVHTLQMYVDIPCIFFDENFSTKTALKILKTYDLKKKKKDELSACLFLQWYLDTKQDN